MSILQKKYGWKPDLPDHRDMYFIPHGGFGAPPIVDLAGSFPAVYDQGELGSCTAQAIAAALQYDDMKQNTQYAKSIPSRLFIYYNERVTENTVNEDSGAQIRTGMKVVSALGVCNESKWWYNIAKFKVKPNKECYNLALKRKALVYLRVNQDLSAVKNCLAAGFPVVFGISVYDSFESNNVAKTGKVPMPNPKESCLGGHAIIMVGYNDNTKMFKFRNSWGPGWGENGYGYLPYSYVLNSDLADDFWTIREVSQ